jgi:2-methylisocitrate lyase-like PEP mutase family enzyme
MSSSWAETLSMHSPLLLPVAHDVLTSRLIEAAGFRAFQIGGFALVGSHLGLPDADLAHFGEQFTWIEDILNVASVPVMVDASNGGFDLKEVARTVSSLESAGADALFIEDQCSPKKCGHMNDKHVVSPEEMRSKIQVAFETIQGDVFLVARTDAFAVEGMTKTKKRVEKYLNAGANGIYVEGLETEKELSSFARSFEGTPLALSILEGGGKTPWVQPSTLSEMGYNMILYPTTLLFRSLQAMAEGLKSLKDGVATPTWASYTVQQYGELVRLPYWQSLEK